MNSIEQIIEYNKGALADISQLKKEAKKQISLIGENLSALENKREELVFELSKLEKAEAIMADVLIVLSPNK